MVQYLAMNEKAVLDFLRNRQNLYQFQKALRIMALFLERLVGRRRFFIEKTSLGALEQKKESHDPHHRFIELKGYQNFKSVRNRAPVSNFQADHMDPLAKDGKCERRKPIGTQSLRS